MANDAALRPFFYQNLARHLGATSAKKLARLGLHSVTDLLWYVPFRLSDPGDLVPISRLRPDMPAVVELEITSTTSKTTRTGTVVVEVEGTDGHDTMTLVHFTRRRNLIAYYKKRFTPGTRGFFAGTAKDSYGTIQFAHPDAYLYEHPSQRAAALREATELQPVYHASSAVGSSAIATAVGAILDTARDGDIPEIVPDAIRAEHDMPSLAQTFHDVHQPADADTYAKALGHLKFTEAFFLQLLLAQRRQAAKELRATAWPISEDGLVQRFDAALPFDLTEGQRAVGDQIASDLANPTPMMRLLQGDVGAGKTVVALRAMLQVVDGGGQAVLLAPTEVLAYQHYRTLSALVADLGVHVTLVTGSQKSAERRRTRAEVASGEANIIVGTHALFSDDVIFTDVGLVVVDEQHRFGVEQRDQLRHGPTGPAHILHMTATPIPRTIALTVFGDLEVSTLREVPAGRATVETFRVANDNERWMARMWERAAEEVAAGGRVFVVCPRIGTDDDASDGADLIEAEDDKPRVLAGVAATAAALADNPALAGISIGQLHGRMSAADKDAAMAAFAAGEAPILVTTTVIEVGVDVPDATVMIILDADRFGLAQLHQLRGRIGRGTKPGLCFVVSQQPTLPSADRLAEFCATTDGFHLAEVDLANRREGDVLGRYQTGGRSGLRVLSAVSDRPIIERARTAARHTLATNSDLTNEPVLRAALLELAAEGEYLERT